MTFLFSSRLTTLRVLIFQGQYFEVGVQTACAGYRAFRRIGVDSSKYLNVLKRSPNSTKLKQNKYINSYSDIFLVFRDYRLYWRFSSNLPGTIYFDVKRVPPVVSPGWQA